MLVVTVPLAERSVAKLSPAHTNAPAPVRSPSTCNLAERSFAVIGRPLITGAAIETGIPIRPHVCSNKFRGRYQVNNQGRLMAVPFPVGITFHGMKATCYSICANLAVTDDDADITDADARRRGKLGGHAAGFNVEGIRDAAAGPILIHVGLQIIRGIP